jgi:hypothetical protein
VFSTFIYTRRLSCSVGELHKVKVDDVEMNLTKYYRRQNSPFITRATSLKCHPGQARRRRVLTRDPAQNSLPWGRSSSRIMRVFCSIMLRLSAIDRLQTLCAGSRDCPTRVAAQHASFAQDDRGFNEVALFSYFFSHRHHSRPQVMIGAGY